MGAEGNFLREVSEVRWPCQARAQWGNGQRDETNRVNKTRLEDQP